MLTGLAYILGQKGLGDCGFYLLPSCPQDRVISQFQPKLPHSNQADRACAMWYALSFDKSSFLLACLAIASFVASFVVFYNSSEPLAQLSIET